MYCNDRWFPLRNESPMLMRRTACCHNLHRTYGTTVVGVVRSLRCVENRDTETSKRCRVTFSPEKTSVEKTTPPYLFRSKTLTVKDGTSSHSPVPRGYTSCQRIYKDAMNSWLPEPVKESITIPLVFRSSRKERQQSTFWNLHQEIVAFKSASKFIRLLRRSWKRLFPTCLAVSFEKCRELLQSVLQAPVGFSEMHFVFSFLCEQETKELSVDALDTVIPRLFLPKEKFSVLMCKHIGEISVWPAYLSMTYEEVDDLLQSVSSSLASDVSEFKQSMVQDVLNDLHTLGLVNTIPMSSLHRIIADNDALMSALRMGENEKKILE